MTKINKNNLTALILAGGKSSRMKGQDKGLLKIGNNYLITYLNSLSKIFCSKVFVNINRNEEIYKEFGLTTCCDITENYQGPLAGIYTGLKKCKTEYLITLPCDGPFIDKRYFKKMLVLENNYDISVAYDGERLQPVYCLIRKSLEKNLEIFLRSGERKIDKWFNLIKFKMIDFSNSKEMFVNINDEKELFKYKNKIRNILENNEKR